MNPREILRRGAWNVLVDLADVGLGILRHARAAAETMREGAPGDVVRATAATEVHPGSLVMLAPDGRLRCACPKCAAKRSN